MLLRTPSQQSQFIEPCRPSGQCGNFGLCCRPRHCFGTCQMKIIPRASALAAGIALLVSPLALRASFAQDHSQTHHEEDTKPDKKKAKVKPKKPPHDMKSMSHENMPGMDHG